MEALAEEENKFKVSTRPCYSLTEVMNRSWATGTFWYTLALSSPSGLFSIFHKQIRPLFCSSDFGEEFNLIMPFLWGRNLGKIALLKTSDKKQYDRDLRQAFENT